MQLILMLKSYLLNKEGLKHLRKMRKYGVLLLLLSTVCLICADRGHSNLQTQSAYQDARYYFLLLRP